MRVLTDISRSTMHKHIIHTYIHTYTHTYIHTYRRINQRIQSKRGEPHSVLTLIHSGKPYIYIYIYIYVCVCVCVCVCVYYGRKAA